jgi:hypothetical protein
VLDFGRVLAAGLAERTPRSSAAAPQICSKLPRQSKSGEGLEQQDIFSVILDTDCKLLSMRISQRLVHLDAKMSPPVSADGKPQKLEFSHMEKSLSKEAVLEDVNPVLLDSTEHNKAFRKVDFHLMPMLMALYLIANLDRANVGNAKIEGLEADLGMIGNDYNLVNMIFVSKKPQSLNVGH